MKIEKVSYGRTYPLGNYASERIDLECSLDAEDVVEEAFQLLKTQCDYIHKKNNPGLYIEQVPQDYNNFTPTNQDFSPQSPEQQPVISQEKKIQNLISQSNSLPELKQWELLSKSNPILQEAYTNKLNELTK